MAAGILDHSELEAQNINIDIPGSHKRNNELAGLDPTSGITFMPLCLN
jgi:hypothetical protein